MILCTLNKTRAVTLVEALTVVVILGIVIFITLPHLTNSKASGDLAAIKAKAVQLNIAKDSYISVLGIDQAQANWSAAANDQARFTLIRNLIAPAVPATVVNLNGTVAATSFSVPGYVFVFSPAGAGEKVIGAPVLIFQDGSLNGALNGLYDAGEAQLPY